MSATEYSAALSKIPKICPCFVLKCKPRPAPDRRGQGGRGRGSDVTTICDRASRLHDSYRLSIKSWGFSAVRAMMFDDIRRFTELGADAYVTDRRKALFRLEDEVSDSGCSAAFH